MYMSALKDLLLAEDARVLDVVLPNLAAYRAIRQGQAILAKKKADQKREIEKMEREGKKTGASINVTAFQAGATAEPTHTLTKAAVSKQATSKSPARGASPMKALSAEDKK